MLIMLILLVTFRIAVTSTHSREELYRLRPYTTSTSQFRPPFNHLYGGMTYRGCRAGKWVKEKRDNLLINIPIAGSRCRSRNVNKLHDNTKSIDNRSFISLKIVKDSHFSKTVPKCMVIHARSLAKADDATPALYAELSSNNIDNCFVSESWLNKKILSQLICLDGYVMVRKDRTGIRTSRRVAAICRKD